MHPNILPAVALVALLAAESDPTPIELGSIAWLRDFDAAATRAKAENRDLFLLFQEVPG